MAIGRAKGKGCLGLSAGQVAQKPRAAAPPRGGATGASGDRLGHGPSEMLPQLYREIMTLVGV